MTTEPQGTNRTGYATCMLCEALCGLEVEHDRKTISAIRGDTRDPFSKGHICPKAAALMDVHADPDRVRAPLVRRGAGFEEASWDTALGLVAERVAAIQKSHGRNAVAVYVGNPVAHSYGAVLYGQVLAKVIATENLYTANSVDGLARLYASNVIYGNQLLIPVPDIDRTHFLLVLGANPVVSNGSVMTAPGCKRRLKAIKERGGRIVVIDPRRSETAEVAGEHHFIRPGTDALLLLAMLETLVVRGLTRTSLPSWVERLERLPSLVAPFPAERVAPVVGMSAGTIRSLAIDFARAPSAACYGRLGTSAVEYGTLTTCLIDLLNLATGNLDRAGGAMFTTPAADMAAFAAWGDQKGDHGRFRTRVSGLPEFNRELPVAALAEELDPGGPGQPRALLTLAGNPVLSTPNGRRLEAALPALDFVASIDLYVNETTRHAHVILPASFGLEHDHYGLLAHSLAVRNTAKYSPALIEAPPGTRPDWKILLDLATGILRRRGLLQAIVAPLAGAIGTAIGPRRVLDFLLWRGPQRVRLPDLERDPHGIDLGPLEPRLPALLERGHGRVVAIPDDAVAEAARLDAALRDGSAGQGLRLIGRRHLLSNNSWMHNSPRLMKTPDRATLLMNPEDARARALADGQTVAIASRVGKVDARLEVSDEVMPGVVSLPHGWGHGREGTRLSVANGKPGASLNDLTDPLAIDRPSGSSSLSTTPVEVTPAQADPAAGSCRHVAGDRMG
ncbi:MAG: molybdopterin-dependent oxidoreductase [Acidobacteriota bacterium]